MWQPSADREALLARAELLTQTRAFFGARGVIEVETPLLAQCGVTDPALEPFIIGTDPPRYLQTSPEYAMKRLLAAYPIDIYQICKAFRAGELGGRHNPEYTLLEWYRVHWDHCQLIREVAELLCQFLGRGGWQVWSWASLFDTILGIDGHSTDRETLLHIANRHLNTPPSDLDRDGLLDLLMSHCIEPAIADWGVVFVVDYPISQAALAREIIRDNRVVGARFECYVDGVELANGYWEAADANTLRRRFEQDNHIREQRGLVQRPIDERLLAAQAVGLPDCAGVALGFDRLLALSLGRREIQSSLTFGWEHS